MPTELGIRWLWYGAGANAVVALLCVVFLFFPAESILGVHPALKPLKFALSFAIYLGTMALLMPALSLASVWKQGISFVVFAVMFVEMFCIVLQALRGKTSHFNTETVLIAAYGLPWAEPLWC